MAYACGVCGEKGFGDVVIFKDHTDKHIVDLLKHDHPHWVEKDGVCQKCYECYKAEIDGSFFKDSACALRNRAINKFWGILGA